MRPPAALPPPSGLLDWHPVRHPEPPASLLGCCCVLQTALLPAVPLALPPLTSVLPAAGPAAAPYAWPTVLQWSCGTLGGSTLIILLGRRRLIFPFELRACRRWRADLLRRTPVRHFRWCSLVVAAAAAA